MPTAYPSIPDLVAEAQNALPGKTQQKEQLLFILRRTRDLALSIMNAQAKLSGMRDVAPGVFDLQKGDAKVIHA